MKQTRRPFGSSIVFVWGLVSAFVCSPSCFVHAGFIINGDFESGNTGFSSEYTFAPNIQPFPGLNGGQYNIVTNPAPFHFAAASYGDHTTGRGNMMMVNADREVIPRMVWSQTVAVSRNTTYEFSAWISTWAIASDLNVSLIRVLINGSSIGQQFAPNTTGVWEMFSASWNSGAILSANIQIYEVGAEAGFPGGGNDFALDDISFHAQSAVVPEPASIIIFSLGVVSMGLARRRSRATASSL
jgi:hypothetical protein